MGSSVYLPLPEYSWYRLACASLVSEDESTLLSDTVLVAAFSMLRRVRRDPSTGDPRAMVTKAEDLDKLSGIILQSRSMLVNIQWQ